MTAKLYKTLGLMSGTSMDGIDLAMLTTDGESHISYGPWASVAFADETRERLRTVLGRSSRDAGTSAIERELTELHAAAIADFRQKHKLGEDAIDLIGFHGQTIWHDPANRETIQLGDGALLAARTGIPVVNDFRTADVQAGGQGAPFASLYHQALTTAGKLAMPLAILNIGGVANVTWLGAQGAICAFDTGPGNAMIDDWLLHHMGAPFDKDGALAASGRVDRAVVESFLALPFFTKRPPKSLDRDTFRHNWCAHLSPADGAATLTELTVESIAASLAHMPDKPLRWLATGGGRHNRTLLDRLGKRLGVPVEPVENVGWRGDALEAEAFAWLAVRSLRGLPLSLPATTGVPHALSGGRHHLPDVAGKTDSPRKASTAGGR